MSGQLLTLAISLPPGLPNDTALRLATMAGRLGFAAVHVSLTETAATDQIAALSEAAAPALVVFGAPADASGTEVSGVVRRNDPAEVAQARAALDAEGATRPLLVAVPISIGRTMSEAEARADLEPRFTGDAHPRVHGIFGAFEQAQEQVLALARAGADGLVLDVPLERDIADVLAQIRALVVGATPSLVHGETSERSEPPRTTFYGT